MVNDCVHPCPPVFFKWIVIGDPSLIVKLFGLYPVAAISMLASCTGVPYALPPIGPQIAKTHQNPFAIFSIVHELPVRATALLILKIAKVIIATAASFIKDW